MKINRDIYITIILIIVILGIVVGILTLKNPEFKNGNGVCMEIGYDHYEVIKGESYCVKDNKIKLKVVMKCDFAGIDCNLLEVIKE